MSGHFSRLLSSLCVLGLLAGCNSTDTSGAFDLGKKKEEATNRPVMVQGACPVVYLREGTAIYRQYAKGAKKNADGIADPEKLVIQAALDQATRQCFQTDQGLKITVVVHGRLVLGPLGQPGTYTLPIRVAATDGDETLYSELTQFQLAVPPEQGSTQFIFTKADVLIPAIPAGNLTRVFAGIDEGPYDTK